MSDLLIRHVTAVTLDPERRVLDDVAIALSADRIAAIGPDAEIAAAHPNSQVIEAPVVLRKGPPSRPDGEDRA
jgi:cytosine/adenosine deaminase-related metal-dependent hydrolase